MNARRDLALAVTLSAGLIDTYKLIRAVTQAVNGDSSGATFSPLGVASPEEGRHP